MKFAHYKCYYHYCYYYYYYYYYYYEDTDMTKLATKDLTFV